MSASTPQRWKHIDDQSECDSMTFVVALDGTAKCDRHQRVVAEGVTVKVPTVKPTKPVTPDEFGKALSTLGRSLRKAFPGLNPNDHILRDACRESVAAMRLGRRIGRTVPTSVIALSLQVAAEEWMKAEREAQS